MTKTQEIPAEIWAVANKICQVWDDPALTIEVAEALLARDTAARKECAEIARDEMVNIYDDSPDIDIECNNLVRRVVAAIEATITGGSK